MSVDQVALQRDFSAAALRYGANAHLQHAVRGELLALTRRHTATPQRIADLGCGTGLLAGEFGNALLLGSDIAFGMCREARKAYPCLQARAEALPFQSDAFDLVFSSLMLQWAEAEAVFAEMRRVLKPGGIATVSTFGPKTLQRLSDALGSGRVHRFLVLDTLMGYIEDASFQTLEVRQEIREQDHISFRALLQSLKAIGAAGKHENRPRGLMTPRQLAEAEKRYMQGREDVTAEWEIVYLVLKK